MGGQLSLPQESICLLGMFGKPQEFGARQWKALDHKVTVTFKGLRLVPCSSLSATPFMGTTARVWQDTVPCSQGFSLEADKPSN